MCCARDAAQRMPGLGHLVACPETPREGAPDRKHQHSYPSLDRLSRYGRQYGEIVGPKEREACYWLVHDDFDIA